MRARRTGMISVYSLDYLAHLHVPVPSPERIVPRSVETKLVAYVTRSGCARQVLSRRNGGNARRRISPFSCT